MRFIAILCLVLCACSASAQDMSVYFGAAVGAFDHDNPDGGAFSDTVSAWKIYGGFQLTNHFGLEIGHGSTSELEGGVSGSPLNVGVHYFSFAHRVEFTTTTFKAMGYLPFDWGALWAGYGVYMMDADVDASNGAFGRNSFSLDDEDEMAALGVEWRLRGLGRSIDLRAEYEWLGFPFSDASTISLGVAYRFEGL